jgi:mRNA interferase RelE/StbE
MTYTILIKRQAQKVLEKISPPNLQRMIREEIENLATNPFPTQSKRLRGFEDTYRIRQGTWRIIYEVRDDELIIEVIKIGSRGDVYKGGF